MTSTSTLTHTGRIVGVVAVTLAVVVAAFGAWFSGADTALAPEPAKLKVALGTSTGATAAATYLNSTAPTKVRYYTSSWTSDSWGPAAGTPCSSVSLATDAVTTKVIQAQGNLRRCI